MAVVDELFCLDECFGIGRRSDDVVGWCGRCVGGAGVGVVVGFVCGGVIVIDGGVSVIGKCDDGWAGVGVVIWLLLIVAVS